MKLLNRLLIFSTIFFGISMYPMGEDLSGAAASGVVRPLARGGVRSTPVLRRVRSASVGRPTFVPVAGEKDSHVGLHSAMGGTVAGEIDVPFQRELLKLAAKQHEVAESAHELRTPLHGVLGNTTLALALIEQLEKGGDVSVVIPELRAYLGAIQMGGQRLAVTINSQLDASRLGQQGGLTFVSKPFVLKSILDEMRANLGVRAKDAGLAFHLICNNDENITLKGDEHRFAEILYNLGGNAIKFTQKGGQITLTVNVAKIAEGAAGAAAAAAADIPSKIKLECSVADTGAGISPDNLQHIWDPHFQVVGVGTAAGSGMGLGLVKKLVELQGGKIKAESRLGEGTIFTFDLDFAVPQDAAISAQPMAKFNTLADCKQALNGITILVVDDEETNRKLAKRLLENIAGAKVLVTDKPEADEKGVESYAQTAYRLLRERPDINIVFMDLQMPNVSGLAATRHIRSKAGLNRSDLPVVGLSGDADKGGQAQGAGMADFISKPAAITDMCRVVTELVRGLR